MTIPGFQSFLLPLLQIASDNQEHPIGEVLEQLALQFGLTEEDKKELLPSGRTLRLNNRVGWARTHLIKACLLESTGRGRFRITQRGLDVLRRNPRNIDIRFLAQFPEFMEFRTLSRREAKADGNDDEDRQTPDEILEASYQSLRHTLAEELLERVLACSPKFFENLVVDLLVAMGYGGSRKDAGQAVGQSGDDGIDGIIKEDKLGLDAVYIQAKRWGTPSDDQ